MKKTFSVTIKMSQDDIQHLYDTGRVGEKAIKELKKTASAIPEIASKLSIEAQRAQIWKKLIPVFQEIRKIQSKKEEAQRRADQRLSQKLDGLFEKEIQKYLDDNGITNFVAFGAHILLTRDEVPKVMKFSAEHLGCLDYQCWNTKNSKATCFKGTGNYRKCPFWSHHEHLTFQEKMSNDE